jgi:hypothetical protein
MITKGRSARVGVMSSSWRLRLSAFSFAFGIFIECAPLAAAAQSCMQDELTKQFIEAKTKAIQCGVAESRMDSIDGASSMMLGGCRRGARIVEAQLGSFKSCAAIYFCATETYRCALREVAAGSNCQTALKKCVRENHIPQFK